MGKIRVFELAKQLNTTSKELLEKLKEMNVSVKSHMSVVDDETVGHVKEVLYGAKSQVVVEKRIKDTVIRRRRKVVAKPQIRLESPPAVDYRA